MIYGIDIGSYTHTLNWSFLKSQGIEFAIIKATQGDYRLNKNLPDLAAAARQAGLAVGLYHWCDPLRDGKTQGNFFLKCTEALDYDFAAVDFEQYWADWNEWPGKIRKVLSPHKISSAGLVTAATILDGTGAATHLDGSQKKLLVYTRASFVHDFASPALTWLKEFPLWIAHWTFGPGTVTLDWENLWKKYASQEIEPALPKGCTEWVLHQWSGDRFILPGLNGEKVDLNRYAGDRNSLRAWLGIAPADESGQLLPRLEEQMDDLLTQAGELKNTLNAYHKLLDEEGRFHANL